jgi:ribose transport system permease protein
MITSASLCGVAGILYGSLSGPSLTYGNAMLLPAYAGAFLGSTQVRPGRFNVWGNVIAVYVLATGVQGMIFVTGERWVNDMFNGVALIAAVGFATWRQNAAKRGPSKLRRRMEQSPLQRKLDHAAAGAGPESSQESVHSGRTLQADPAVLIHETTSTPLNPTKAP